MCTETTDDLRKMVEEVVAKYPLRTGNILGILEELQERHPKKYLPCSTLAMVAEVTGVAPAQIFSMSTFYAFFNLKPQGKHTITVCRGTACHTRGSKALLDALIQMAGVKAESDDDDDEDTGTYTSPDGRLTIRTVACFGQCALAPVVGIDHDIHGYVNEVQLRGLVKDIEAREEPS